MAFRVEGFDIGYCGLRCGDRGLGGCVVVVVWAKGLVVHADAADEGALAAGVAEEGEGIGCGDVDGCEVGGAGCAVGEGARDYLVVDAKSGGGSIVRACLFLGGSSLDAEARFDWEGV